MIYCYIQTTNFAPDKVCRSRYVVGFMRLANDSRRDMMNVHMARGQNSNAATLVHSYEPFI